MLREKTQEQLEAVVNDLAATIKAFDLPQIRRLLDEQQKIHETLRRLAPLGVSCGSALSGYSGGNARVSWGLSTHLPTKSFSLSIYFKQWPRDHQAALRCVLDALVHALPGWTFDYGDEEHGYLYFLLPPDSLPNRRT